MTTYNSDTYAIVEKFIAQIKGRPLSPISDKQEADPYVYSRLRLARLYGQVQRYLCFDCNSQADRFSYDFTDPAEYVKRDSGTRYSLSTERYVPRCYACDYQHRATTTSSAYNPEDTPKCFGKHVKFVPLSFVDNYEFRFCKLCDAYRRYPKRGYNAKYAFPAITLGKTLSLEL